MISLFGNSSKKINASNTKLIGVTGSYGKTLVAETIRHILSEGGFKVGYTTSLGNSANGENHDEKHTIDNTSRKRLLEFIKEGSSKNLDFIIVEINEKNLARGLYKGLQFDSGAITNLVGELDHYNNWNDYADTKFQLVRQIKDNGLLVVNGEDQNAANWFVGRGNEIKKNIYCFWINTGNLTNLYHSFGGITFDLDSGITIETRQTGTFNHFNTYMATKLCERYLDINRIKAILKDYKNPAGRMDLVHDEDKHILIDYADSPHTHLQNLSFLKSLKGTGNKIISVIGNKGDIHKSRRQAGTTVGELSDTVVIAPNDPNMENTMDINSQIHNYTTHRGGALVDRFVNRDEHTKRDFDDLMKRTRYYRDGGETPVFSFDNHDYSGRLDAIRFANKIANTGDIVYIAGKGADDSIMFDNSEYEWSDAEAVKIALGLSKLPY